MSSARVIPGVGTEKGLEPEAGNAAAGEASAKKLSTAVAASIMAISVTAVTESGLFSGFGLGGFYEN